MGKIYAREIIEGRRTYDSIGTLWKTKVYNALVEMVENAEITAEQFEEFVGEAYPNEDETVSE